MTAVVADRHVEFELPWGGHGEQDERFQRILKKALLVLLVFGIVIPWLPIIESQDEQQEKDIKTTKIVLKADFLPEPEIENKITKPKPKPKPKQARAQEKSPAQSPQTTAPNNKNPSAQKKLKEDVGIAAFKNQLNALRSSVDVQKFQNKNVSRSGGDTQRATRTVLNEEKVTRTSGGVQDEPLTITGNTELASYQAAQVSGPVMAEVVSVGNRRYGSGQSSGRDMESIRRTFEKHKGAINTLYVRALRQQPDLQGKFLFKIVIEPSGMVSDITLLSSELQHPGLEQQLLQRFSSIDFGAKNVDPTPVRYTWNFLPS